MTDKVICPGCGQTFPVCGAGMWDIQEHQARSKRCQQAQHRAEAEAELVILRAAIDEAL